MPEFKALIDTLYQAVHASDENVRIQHARKLYQDLVGAPPLNLEDRVETLKVLNQQLQDEVTATKTKAEADAQTKWKVQHDTLKEELARARTKLSLLDGDNKGSTTRARLHLRLRSRLNAARNTLIQLEQLEDV